MDTARIAHPAPRPNIRELRALALVEEHFDEIAQSHHGGRYTVPSCTGEGSYSVTYTARDESCECPDWQFGYVCKHVLAVAVVRAKTSIYAECGRRFRHRDLYEVGEDSLTYFEGDMLCEACAIGAGVLQSTRGYT